MPQNRITSRRARAVLGTAFFSFLLAATLTASGVPPTVPAELEAGFATPPPSDRPGVYWYFLDGNRDPRGMTEDLEAMSRAGIGSAIMLEVDLGVPRGPVGFMSTQWVQMFGDAVAEAKKLGIEITLGSGPGWTGSGGPWVTPEQSMQHLVASSVEAIGRGRFQSVLPVPPPRQPYFDTVTADLEKQRQQYYRDVAVLAFLTPLGSTDESALYERSPYTSERLHGRGVLPFLPSPSPDPTPAPYAVIQPGNVLDLTERLRPDGTLDWIVPSGRWTVMRFGARNNGANTRPAPKAGYGFESDKFSAAALDAHLAHYVDKLLKQVGPITPGAGLTMLHIDSWEMGAQNWTPDFRDQFKRRRGYDPQPWYPAYTGRIVASVEQTERFLWDVRQTAQELVIENHAEHLKAYAHGHGLGLSIEPYDMNPTADLELGAVADVPMGEFWANYLDSSYSCIEAASVAHTMGRPVVGAESFTSVQSFTRSPADLKNQLDWAFATGINHIVIHTFQHQPLGDDVVPGMDFGPYGVSWNRNEPWWPLVGGFHRYISRCSFVLRQGVSVADILYLTPEGAPQVFRAPNSALAPGGPSLPDRRGFNFDGCAPGTLIARAQVRNGRIAFPDGTAYRVLVLPAVETMTPALLAKIDELLEAGAVVIGEPPRRSPSLSGYPGCDDDVRRRARAMWGDTTVPAVETERGRGLGRLFWGGDLHVAPTTPQGELYPTYAATARLLHTLGLTEDFRSNGPVRYTHRRTKALDIYFVANRSDEAVTATCTFRTTAGAPTLWDAVTGQIRALPEFSVEGEGTSVPLRFAAHQSFFVVFPGGRANASLAAAPAARGQANFPAWKPLARLDGPWEILFQSGRGAPPEVEFSHLQDWITRPEAGIRYFSGIATYRKRFDIPAATRVGHQAGSLLLDVGTVKDICRVRLNGHDLGTLWTAPWRVDISEAARNGANELEIDVANLWPNRLIGDQQPADADVRTLQWKSGLLNGQAFKTGRYTFVTTNPYTATSPLLSSGLLGPVSLLVPADEQAQGAGH